MHLPTVWALFSVGALASVATGVLVYTSLKEGSSDPHERADALVKEMSLDEKLQMVHGDGWHWAYNGYVGQTKAVSRLGIPAVKLEDGPQGVADGVEGATAWPSALTVAASWDRDLMKQFASAMAVEQRIKGSNVMLGPMVNIARVPRGGRNFESFGEDPHLAAEMAKVYVKGVQSQKVVACVKHFALNNQEQDRMSVSADVSERTRWELYYPAFKAAVDAGVGSLMCSYNRINGTYACENSKTLSEDLKVKLGFSGWVMSDWGATHSTVQAALAGLDQEMPQSSYFGEELKKAIKDGKVPESRLNDMVQRMLWAMISVGVLDWVDEQGNLHKNATSAEHNALAHQLAAAGTVLLKNEGQLLPLPADIKSIAVFGDDAEGKPQAVDGGSGGVIPPFIISPLSALKTKAAQRGASVTYMPTSSAAKAGGEAAKADVALVFVSTDATEGKDRDSLGLGPDQDALVRTVLSTQPRTVVVVHSPGAVLIPWADSAPAILFPMVPGQADGAAIADVLWGDVNPSARLPITLPKTEAEMWIQGPQQYPGVDMRAVYSEELLVGYRWYNAKGVEPLFPFGHGLSYTTFAYNKLTVRPQPSNSFTITAEVLNNGTVAGSEVAQLYLTYPPEAGEPPRQLRGFQKVAVDPGQRKGVTFVLDKRDFSIWSPAADGWVVVPGTYTVELGASSRDMRLQTDVKVEPELFATYLRL